MAFLKQTKTGMDSTEGLGGAACSAGLSEPVVELVDIASTSGEFGGMKCPAAPVRRARRCKNRENRSDDDYDSDASTMSTLSTSSAMKSRKRGRPPTTGEYVGLAEAKQRLMDLSMQQEAIEAEGRILDRGTHIDVADRNMRPDEEIADELRMESTSSLAAIVAEEMQLVRKTAKMSSNLKGTVQRALKDSAQRTRLAAMEMAKRQGGGGGRAAALEAENMKLRAEVEVLREEVRSLSGQVERLLSAQVNSVEIDSHGSKEAHEVSEVSMCSQSVTAVADTPSPPLAKENIEVDYQKGLLEQIATLIDRKLAVFYLEVFPERAARPPLGAKRAAAPENLQKTVPATGKKLQKSEKRKKDGKGKSTPPKNASTNPGQPAPTASAAPTITGATTAPPEQPEQSWSQVVGRKAARKAAKKTEPQPATQDAHAKAPAKKTASKAEAKKVRPPRAPKTAAVTLTVPEGCSISYAEAMKAVRQKISLQDIGICQVRPKRALTGGLILEVPGPEGAEKAKTLASQMTAALAGTGAKVAQPTKQAELRVRGLDDSVTADEVAAALAEAGGCAMGDIKIGEIRRSPTGLGTVWARCPAAAARKLAISGRLMVGWVSAKVDALEARPLQCHRCLEMGHVRQRCTANIDRSALCYNCGAPGHRAGECPATAPNCPICADAGSTANHRMGSKLCSTSKKARKEKAGKQGPTATPSASGVKPSGVKKTPAKPAGKPALGGSGLEEAMEMN